MLYLHKNLIKPFLDTNKEKLSQVTDRFSKFFNFRTEVINGFYGKGFNNPDKVTFVDAHKSNGLNFELKKKVLSHFRDVMNTKHFGEYPITNIYIDFNYFLCYFMPLFEKLTK